MNPALVDHLLKHSVKRGEFTLRSGKPSNWFIDAKQTTCSPDGMLLVADAVLAVLPDDITAIGGLTMGADAVAFGVAAVAATRGRMLRSFSVRKEEKDHGAGGRIAGALRVPPQKQPPTLQLSIDSRLQKAAQNALIYGMRQSRLLGHSPTGASAVAIDPWTSSSRW